MSYFSPFVVYFPFCLETGEGEKDRERDRETEIKRESERRMSLFKRPKPRTFVPKSTECYRDVKLIPYADEPWKAFINTEQPASLTAALCMCWTRKYSSPNDFFRCDDIRNRLLQCIDPDPEINDPRSCIIYHSRQFYSSTGRRSEQKAQRQSLFLDVFYQLVGMLLQTVHDFIAKSINELINSRIRHTKQTAENTARTQLLQYHHHVQSSSWG